MACCRQVSLALADEIVRIEYLIIMAGREEKEIANDAQLSGTAGKVSKQLDIMHEVACATYKQSLSFSKGEIAVPSTIPRCLL